MRALVFSLLRVAIVVAGQSDRPRGTYSLLGEGVSWRSLHGQHKGRWRVAVAMVVVVVLVEKHRFDDNFWNILWNGEVLLMHTDHLVAA